MRYPKAPDQGRMSHLGTGDSPSQRMVLCNITGNCKERGRRVLVAGEAPYVLRPLPMEGSRSLGGWYDCYSQVSKRLMSMCHSYVSRYDGLGGCRRC